MKRRVKKCLHALLPALMLWAAPMASSVLSVSRFRTRKAVVKSVIVCEGAEGFSPRNENRAARDPFAVFGNSIGAKNNEARKDDTRVLAFLRKEGLLSSGAEKESALSGDLTVGRKDFAAEMCSCGGAYCWWYSTKTYCTSYGYNWVTAPPVIKSSSVSNINATSFTLTVDLSHPGTVYAVAVLRTGAVPSSAQVKAGQDGAGNPAAASVSKACGTGDEDLTLNGLTNADQNRYNVYFIAEDSDGMTATPKVHNVLTPASFTPTDVYTYGTNTHGNPDIEKDGSNNVYIFHEIDSTECRISKWNGSSWTVDPITMSSDGAVSMKAQRADMVIDGNGDFHVLLNRSTTSDASSGDMNHNMYDESESAWSGFAMVYDGSTVSDYCLKSPDFAFADSNNKIHLTFEVNGTMYYATNTSGSWATTTLETLTNDGGPRWTVVESSGTAHAFYENDSRHELHMASGSTGSFSIDTIVDASADTISAGSVIIDGSNKMHLVYSNTTDGTAFYMTNASGSWVEEPLTSTGFFDLEARDIRLHGSDVYVLMFNDSEDMFYFKRKVAGSWSDGEIFEAGEGRAISFLIDTSNNKIYVPFQPELLHIRCYIESISAFFGTENNDPTISIADGNLSYTEQGAATPIDPTATANDDDGDADWDGGTLTVQITANAEAADEISIPDNAGAINTDGTNLRNDTTVIGTLSASEGTVTNNTTLTVTFNANATNALVREVVRAIHYRNTSDNPGTGDRTVTFTVTDKNLASASDTRTIVITPVNDPPTDISLSNASVDENEPAGTVVGTISTTDPDD